MKAQTFLLLALALSGCGDSLKVEPFERCTVPAEHRDALLKFVIDCAKAANPMSDEEGEDLVQQCERTGAKAFETCETVYESLESESNWVPCSTKLSQQSQQKCQQRGWKP